MITILFAHPKHNSMNGKILEAVQNDCKELGVDYTVIDLYKDGFSPVLTAEELDLFYKGVALDPLVKQYQDILLKTDKLISIFPIWYNECPAIYKGFFERVCLGNFAFEYTPDGVRPKLTNIKKALILTTSNAPMDVLKQFQGNMIENQVINHMMKGMGVQDNKWLDFGGMQEADDEQKNTFLHSLMQEIANM